MILKIYPDTQIHPRPDNIEEPKIDVFKLYNIFLFIFIYLDHIIYINLQYLHIDLLYIL